MEGGTSHSVETNGKKSDYFRGWSADENVTRMKSRRRRRRAAKTENTLRTVTKRGRENVKMFGRIVTVGTHCARNGRALRVR